MKCPLCKGTGKTVSRSQRTAKEKQEKAVQLRKMGFKFREIQNALGYKSPNSVSKALKQALTTPLEDKE